eukprot:g2723.t1
MRPTKKRQLPMHLDKWIVTVRQGKGLTRGDQRRDSFFTKLSPVCELSLDGEQGPFSTSVKPNTSQPSWDDSVEFEARHPAPLPPPPRPWEGGDDNSKDERYGGDPVRPPAGPKLSVVCYTKSNLSKNVMAATEIGRAEVTLASTGGGGGVSPNKVHRIPLTRMNASGDKVAAGSVTLEYMLVPGIPRPSISMAALAGDGAAERERGQGLSGARVARALRRNLSLYGLNRPPRKLALLALVGALIAAVLAVRLSGVRRPAFPGVELSPIPVPFKLPAGKYKGSSTHHVRLQDDGNIVVATGPKPLPPGQETTTAAPSGAAATTLWQSGPLRSGPGNPGGKGKGKGKGDGDVGGDACKKCQVRVGKDGRVVLVREREELAVFSPSWAEAFFKILPSRDQR